jgi:hypothetical protein
VKVSFPVQLLDGVLGKNLRALLKELMALAEKKPPLDATIVFTVHPPERK